MPSEEIVCDYITLAYKQWLCYVLFSGWFFRIAPPTYPRHSASSGFGHVPPLLLRARIPWQLFSVSLEIFFSASLFFLSPQEPIPDWTKGASHSLGRVPCTSISMLCIQITSFCFPPLRECPMYLHLDALHPDHIILLAEGLSLYWLPCRPIWFFGCFLGTFVGSFLWLCYTCLYCSNA